MKTNFFNNIAKNLSLADSRKILERWDSMCAEDIEEGKHPYYALENTLKIIYNDIDEEVKNKFNTKEINYWTDFLGDISSIIIEINDIRDDLKKTMEEF